jgi:hypothetical protein
MDENPPRDSSEFAESESLLDWEVRVFVVALFWSIPGMLVGTCLCAILTGSENAVWWITAGFILGACAGGTLEADLWSLASKRNRAQVDEE